MLKSPSVTDIVSVVLDFVSAYLSPDQIYCGRIRLDSLLRHPRYYGIITTPHEKSKEDSCGIRGSDSASPSTPRNPGQRLLDLAPPGERGMVETHQTISKDT